MSPKDLHKEETKNLGIETKKLKKQKKLYRCQECTNSVILTVEADVVCTRCNLTMRLFEAKQTNLFEVTNKTDESD